MQKIQNLLQNSALKLYEFLNYNKFIGNRKIEKLSILLLYYYCYYYITIYIVIILLLLLLLSFIIIIISIIVL